MIKRRLIGKIIFNAVFSCILIMLCMFAVRFGRCFSAAEHLPETEAVPVVRVRLYGASSETGTNTVSAAITIIDSDGNDFANVERSWNGAVLCIDFVSADFSGKTVLFPESVYGKDVLGEKPGRKSRTNLAPYYLENGQCLLLGSESAYSARVNMYRLAKFALSPSAQLTTGFSKRYTVDLSGCVSGADYYISTGYNGLITIQKQ